MTATAVVLFRLGGDPALDPVRRGAARVLSFYQRAPVHLLAETGWGEFDWMVSSLLRWILLKLRGRHARRWHIAPPQQAAVLRLGRKPACHHCVARPDSCRHAGLSRRTGCADRLTLYCRSDLHAAMESTAAFA